MDRVQPLKLESTATGGTQLDYSPVSLNHNEDYVDSRGICFQNDTSDDEDYYIARDVSNNIGVFTSNTERFRVTSGGNFVFSVSSYTFNGAAYDINSTDVVTISGTSVTFFGEYALPTADGSANQVIKTDGSGTLTWEDSSSGGYFELDTASTPDRVAQPTSAAYTEDFVFGSPALNDDGFADHDSRFLFEELTYSFRAGKATSTEWDTRGLGSFAFGLSCQATANYSQAGGNNSDATAEGARAIGYSCVATGIWATSKGYNCSAKGQYSTAEGHTCVAGLTDNQATSMAHAEGYSCIASGTYGSHAEGRSTDATGVSSHSEGYDTLAEGQYSHSEGYNTRAVGRSSHAEGEGNGTATYQAGSRASHIEGYYTLASNGDGNHAEGYKTIASGTYGSHSEGDQTTASGTYGCHAEGYHTLATGNDGSHSEGWYTLASGIASHAEGYGVSGSPNTASSNGAHVEGYKCSATTGYGNHAEGGYNLASGSSGAHVEGYYNVASGQSSHASGYHTIASGNYSHTEGRGGSGAEVKAIGACSHAEGYYTIAGTATTDFAAHAEGYYCQAQQQASHAEGQYTEAQSDYSHSEGYYSIAVEKASHAEGDYSKARYHGTHARASGKRGTEVGSLQSEHIEISGISTSNTSDLYLRPIGNISEVFIIPEDYIYDVLVLLVGVVTDTSGVAVVGETIHMTLRGAVKNIAGTTSTVYSSKTVEYADASLVACDASVQGYVSSDYLAIYANGLGAMTIQWHGTLIINETYLG